MSVFRKNTLVVDFSGLPKRPDAGKVQQFLEKKVKLKLEDTKTIQLHNLRNCVFIETIDSETAIRYEMANNYKHTIACNDKEFKIPVYVDSEAVTVRVHDLPTHTPHVAVTDFMGQYGAVISIARERWKHHFPGYFNGVRVLRMRLSRQNPSIVTINCDSTLVSYRGQPKTCHHCGEAANPKQKCGKTLTTTINAKTSTPTPTPAPAPAAEAAPTTNRSRGAQLHGAGDEFPALPNNESEKQREKTNNVNTTSDKGNDCGDADDDDDGSDTDNFTEATNRKRRIPKKVLNQKESELKKLCISQGSQILDHNPNPFQALVEVDPICPSDEQMNE